MAIFAIKHSFFFNVAILSIVSLQLANASDPDILSDFLIPEDKVFGNLDGNFFTFTNFRGIFKNKTSTYKGSKASKEEFPALEGQSISLAILQYPSEEVNPPHSHPRSSELLFLLHGCLEVGFVDTTGKLFNQTLQKGDIFVFPKGLVHYQYNPNAHKRATAISAFGSASVGVVSMPTTLFSTGIDDGILAKAFKTDVGTIEKIKDGLGMEDD